MSVMIDFQLLSVPLSYIFLLTIGQIWQMNCRSERRVWAVPQLSIVVTNIVFEFKCSLASSNISGLPSLSLAQWEICHWAMLIVNHWQSSFGCIYKPLPQQSCDFKEKWLNCVVWLRLDCRYCLCLTVPCVNPLFRDVGFSNCEVVGCLHYLKQDNGIRGHIMPTQSNKRFSSLAQVCFYVAASSAFPGSSFFFENQSPCWCSLSGNFNFAAFWCRPLALLSH